jgi:hypothetical protein
MGPSSHFAMSNDGAVVRDLKNDRLLKLNTIGAEMWALLSRGMPEQQVIQKIALQYGVDAQRVRRDLQALLAQGAEMGLSPRSVTISDGPIPEAVNWQSHSLPAVPAASPVLRDVVKSILGLLLFDVILLFRSLESLCSIVQSWPVQGGCQENESSVIAQIVCAVERASVWYPKKALCLQRSAVATCLLRHHGVQARMVVGVRPMPLLAHAWVEVNRRVVNDSPRVKSFYQSLTSY